MARKKKLPLIEDFDNIPEEALVPEDEQPYEIPDDWKWVRLGAVATVVKDKTEEFSFGTSYVGLEHLSSGGGLSHVGDAYGLESAKTVFSDGDVLYGRLRPYLNKHWIAERSGVCSTDILVFRSQPVIDVVWFDAWLGTDFFVSTASSNTRGINLPRVSEPFLVSAPVPLPPLGEQERIVEKLEASLAQIDDAVSHCGDLSNQVRALKSSLIDGVTSGMWSPFHRTLKYSEREENFQRYKIADLGKVITGNTPSTKNRSYYGSEVPFVKPADVDQGRHISGAQNYLSPLGSTKARVLPPKSVAVVCIGSVGKTGFLEVEAAINQQINAVIPNEKVDPVFLFYFFGSSSFQRQVVENASSTTLAIINKGRFSNLDVFLPNLELQQQLARFLDTAVDKLDKLTGVVDGTVEKLEGMRQGLLSFALGGRLRDDHIDFYT